MVRIVRNRAIIDQKRSQFRLGKGILLAALCLLPFITEAQTTTAKMDLQGNISKLSTYKHVVKNIVIENNTVVSYEKVRWLEQSEYLFDKKGLLLAKNEINDMGVITLSYIYEYNELGKLVEETLAASGQYLQGRTEYKYDKKGNKIKKLVYDDRDSLKTTTVYQYDSLGNLVSEKMYNKINFLVTDIGYQHDERGNIIFVNSVKVPIIAKPPYQEVMKFDDKNHLIYKSFTERDTLKWEYFASYTKKDSLMYEEVKDRTGKLLSASRLTFNRKNKRIALEQYNQSAGVSLATHYQYDKKGKLLTEKIFMPNRTEPLAIRTFFYDEKGNWIYCIEEDKVKHENSIYYRKFNYY